MVEFNFISLLKDPTTLTSKNVSELKNIIEEFPYFQSARGLYLKSLKNQNSFKYNKELKITAAHTADRTVLFDFITSIPFNISTKKSTKSKPLPVINLEEPLTFSVNETYSFNEWLQLSLTKPIVRAPQKMIKKTSEKTSIINRFIKSNAKITPVEKNKSITENVSENNEASFLMTETLARVYLAQKKYKNAIQAYRILSLKYPEKSSFFADQIKSIRILEKTKLETKNKKALS